MNNANARRRSAAAETWYEVHERDPSAGPISPWTKLGVYLTLADAKGYRQIPGRIYRVVEVRALEAWTAPDSGGEG